MKTGTAQAPALASYCEAIVVERQLKAGRRLAESLHLGHGQRVLELGCGTGLLAEYLADCVGAAGEVLGLDALALRVHIAHQRGRHNLRFQIGGPDQLARFGRGSFDAIVANGVFHSWPDAPRALAECARLLAPGGRLGLVTHSAAHPHPAQLAQAAVLAQPPYADHPPPAEARDHAVDAGQLGRLLREAGFDDVRLHAQPEGLVHASAEVAIEFMQAGAWGRFLMHLPEALRAGARAEVLRRLEAQRGPEGIRHDGLRLFAIAGGRIPS